MVGLAKEIGFRKYKMYDYWLMTTFVLIGDVCLEDIHKPMNIPAALCQDVCVGRDAM